MALTVRKGLIWLFKKVILDLFKNLEMSILKCEAWKLAKSHPTSFPLILNTSPIVVIHFDVSGPSRVPTMICYFYR